MHCIQHLCMDWTLIIELHCLLENSLRDRMYSQLHPRCVSMCFFYPLNTFLLEYIHGVSRVSLSCCLAQFLEAKSSCTKDYNAHAVTDPIVLLFSKCQVYRHNHQGTECTRTDFKELDKIQLADGMMQV